MIVVIGTLTVRPDAVGLLKSLAPPHVARTLAEAGCRFFSLGVADEAAGLVTIAEAWQDDAAMAHHHALPYTKDFMDALGGAVLGLDVRLYDIAGERTVPAFDTIAGIGRSLCGRSHPCD